jgi:phosphoglycerate dehydrogenase-like enzyme
VIRVLITDNDLGDTAWERALLTEGFAAHGLATEVHVADVRREEDVVAAAARIRPHAIVVQWAPVTDAVLEAAPECTVVSRVGIGIDMIDLAAAAARGVTVRNVPHYCTEEVATHAVALGLALWRRLPQLDADLRGGTWAAAASAPHIRRLSQATVGLIGVGRIGLLVAKAFSAWGAEVVVVDPAPVDLGYPVVDLAELAERADLVSLHCPLTEQTENIVDGDLLGRLARRPILVNTSRGGLADSAAVAAALHDGTLSGAGLDVFPTEPLSVDDPLLSAPNTLLTPHAAWCSEAALPDLRRGAVDNVVAHLTAGP